MGKNQMKKFTDKYFLRSNEVLKADKLNPWVNMQVFVRKGPGRIYGIDEAVELIMNNSNIEQVGGRIYAKKEGSLYEPKETIMNIIAPIQEIMELETVYLGVIAATTTLKNGDNDIDLNIIKKNVEQVVDLAQGRPVLYFGARHWHYNRDKEIAKAAYDGGARNFATDNGAEQFQLKGMGTIPHALENIYAYYHCLENAVAKSTEAFDNYIDKTVPRVALVDYANREIKDSIDTIALLEKNGSRLNGVRVDTCGENVMEEATKGDMKYWEGKGVTVTGVAMLKKLLNQKDKRVKIVLSSGFSNPEKVKVFNEGEKYFGLKLYDTIGAGFLDNVRAATADIIAIGETPEDIDYFVKDIDKKNIIHKVGRPPIYNKSLERII